MVHKNIRFFQLWSFLINQLPIVFHILYHVETKNLSEPVEKFTDWERFQSFASELISPRIEIDSKEAADKGVPNNHYIPWLEMVH
jgi:hypothetical protein